MGRLFHPAAEVNWSRASVVVGAAVVLWTGIVELMPEAWSHKGFVILAAVQSGLTFLMRSRSQSARTRKSDPKPSGMHE